MLPIVPEADGVAAKGSTPCRPLEETWSVQRVPSQ